MDMRASAGLGKDGDGTKDFLDKGCRGKAMSIAVEARTHLSPLAGPGVFPSTTKREAGM